MHKMFARFAKIVLIACALLVVYWLGLIYSNRVSLATANVYYGLANAWVQRWPAAGNKYAPQVTSALIGIGILRTVRMEAEPGISFLLDPHDLVSSAILATKQWQPEIWNAVSPVLTEGSVF